MIAKKPSRAGCSAKGLLSLLLTCLVGTSGCDTKTPEAPRPDSAGALGVDSQNVEPKRPAGPSVPEPPPAAAPTRPFRFPAAPRLVAIGDLHGDLAVTRQVLRLAGAIDEGDRWIGGDLVVVQTGDQLDRGDDEREILELLARLSEEARAAGGALHVLNGNHEAMNALGDFRYVTPGARDAFNDAEPRSPWEARFTSEWRGRASAFLPGGQFAKLLSERDVVIVVGDTVFVHGGVRPPHVDHGLERLNAETRGWMQGTIAQPPRLIVDPEGPLWTRVYAPEVLDQGACAVLKGALTKLGANRMVVGHSVQPQGIAPGCDERIWRIDVGLARHYGGPIEILEIRGDEVRVLRAERER